MATEHVFKISTHTNHGISEATSLDTPPSWGNNIARDIIDNNGPVVAKNKWDRRTGSVVLTKKNEKKNGSLFPNDLENLKSPNLQTTSLGFNSRNIRNLQNIYIFNGLD